MLLIKEVIPFTVFPKMFEPIHPIEKEYHELFARQLNLFEEDDLNLFNIPAVSLLINDELKPHCDSLNPIDPEGDATQSRSKYHFQIYQNQLHIFLVTDSGHQSRSV